MSEATQRNTGQVMEWYRRVHRNPPFQTDGMCLKVCRTPRNILPKYPSALSAAINTPKEFRVTKVENIKRGMVVFFDDPNDGNPFGHIVTTPGRPAGVDIDLLSGLITWTNSVKSGELVQVRADYFPEQWGDSFQFAAPYLNGEPFYDLLEEKKPPKPPAKPKFHNIREAIASIEEGIDDITRAIHAQERAGNERWVRILRRDREKARETVKDLKALYKSGRG